METIVKKTLPDGTIQTACWFYNDYPPQYNLLTLWMLLNNLSSSIMDKRIRDMHQDKVEETAHFYMIWADNICYSVRKPKRNNYAKPL